MPARMPACMHACQQPIDLRHPALLLPCCSCSLSQVLGVVREATQSGVKAPIVMFTYYNPIMARGLDKFCRQIKEAGASGACAVHHCSTTQQCSNAVQHPLYCCAGRGGTHMWMHLALPAPPALPHARRHALPACLRCLSSANPRSATCCPALPCPSALLPCRPAGASLLPPPVLPPTTTHLLPCPSPLLPFSPAGLLVPDIPLEETPEIREVASSHGLELVLLTTPTTPQERMQRIAQSSQGFVYLVSLTGAHACGRPADISACSVVWPPLGLPGVGGRAHSLAKHPALRGRGGWRPAEPACWMHPSCLQHASCDACPMLLSTVVALKWLLLTSTALATATAGVTGMRGNMESRVEGLITKLQSVTDKPVCVGFGVSGPEQVRGRRRMARRMADGGCAGAVHAWLCSDLNLVTLPCPVTAVCQPVQAAAAAAADMPCPALPCPACTACLQARQIREWGAEGVICGSALVKALGEAPSTGGCCNAATAPCRCHQGAGPLASVWCCWH